jgi:hypothetical protein
MGIVFEVIRRGQKKSPLSTKGFWEGVADGLRNDDSGDSDVGDASRQITTIYVRLLQDYGPATFCGRMRQPTTWRGSPGWLAAGRIAVVEHKGSVRPASRFLIFAHAR